MPHSPDAESRPSGRLHVSHWIGALALLACEILLLRSRFKTDVLAASADWWAPALRLARFNAPWGLSVLGTTLAIGRARFASSPALRRLQPTSPRQRVVACIAHALALAIFYASTAALLEGGATSSGARTAVLVLWLASGAAVLASLVAIVCPLRGFGPLFVEQRWTFLGGLVAGTVAFLCAQYVTTEWPLWEPMNVATLWVADQFLDAFVGAHLFEPHAAILGLDGFNVHVTRACSGYEGIGLFTVFYTLFLFIERDRLVFPRALVLLPLGIAAVWTLNALRIAVLVLIGARVSPTLAVDGFHVYAGWPSVIAVALGAIVLSTRFRTFGARIADRPASGAEATNPTATYLMPLMASIGAWMVAGAVIEQPIAVAPVRVAAVLAVLWCQRSRAPVLGRGVSWVAVGLGAAAFAVWVGLRAWSGELGQATSGLGWQRHASWMALCAWWPIAVIGHVVLAPLAEEYAFRGFLARRFMAAEFEDVDPRHVHAGAVLASSVLFGVLHEHWVAATLAGLLYALAYRWRGRLIDAVVAHAATNALVIAAAAATGRWELWISQ